MFQVEVIYHYVSAPPDINGPNSQQFSSAFSVSTCIALENVQERQGKSTNSIAFHFFGYVILKMQQSEMDVKHKFTAFF